MSTIDSIKPNTNNKPITVTDLFQGWIYTRIYLDASLAIWTCDLPDRPSSYGLTFLDSWEDLATDGPDYWMMNHNGLVDGLRILASDLRIDGEELADRELLKKGELVAHAADAAQFEPGKFTQLG